MYPLYVKRLFQFSSRVRIFFFNQFPVLLQPNHVAVFVTGGEQSVGDAIS